MKITKSQLKQIIREEASRLKKQYILEDKKKAIVKELRVLNEDKVAQGQELNDKILERLKDGLEELEDSLSDYGMSHHIVDKIERIIEEIGEEQGLSEEDAERLSQKIKIEDDSNTEYNEYDEGTVTGNVSFNGKEIISFSSHADGYGFSYDGDINVDALKLIAQSVLKELNDNNLNEEDASVAVDKVKEAFLNSDESYLKKSLEQRNPGKDSAGSTFLETLSIDDLINADWEPYNHPNISSPAIGFKSSIPGKLGVAEMKSLPKDLKVKFQPAHKGEGEGAEAVAEIPESNLLVKHTTLILGPKGDGLTVWTFFPGDATPKFDPISFDEVRSVVGGEGDVSYGTVEDAINLGFNFAKNGSTSLNESIRQIIRKGFLG
jgi:hypothetical protein